MKLYNISLAMLLGISTLTSCSDKLNVENPNEQTTANFGVDELEENVVAAYNHIRMEGSYARVGYTIDVTRGDEVWNSSQVWYMPFDDYNLPEDGDIGWWMVILAGGYGVNGIIPLMFVISVFLNVVMMILCFQSQ